VGPDLDAAVGRLVRACGGTWDEATAARMGLLVQACAATTALVRNALRRDEPAETIVADTLRDDPPVPVTRRIRDGEPVELDLTGLPFGAGPHACPGRDHGAAIAVGMIEAVTHGQSTRDEQGRNSLPSAASGWQACSMSTSDMRERLPPDLVS
jgi:hypothetical protein